MPAKEDIYFCVSSELTDLVHDIIIYDGMPDYFPIDTMKILLTEYGLCLVGNVCTDQWEGKPMPVMCTPHGVTPWPFEFDEATIAGSKIKGGTYKEITDNVVIMRNTHSYRPLTPVINTYAALITEAILTLRMTLINKRCPYVPTATDNNTKDSFDLFFDKLADGCISIPVVSKSIYDNIQSLPNAESGTGASVNDCIIAINNLYRAFFKRLGVAETKDKSQAVLSDEGDTAETASVRWIIPMLEQAKVNCEKLNKVFGWKVKARFNERYYDIVNEMQEEEAEETEKKKEDDEKNECE